MYRYAFGYFTIFFCYRKNILFSNHFTFENCSSVQMNSNMNSLQLFEGIFVWKNYLKLTNNRICKFSTWNCIIPITPHKYVNWISENQFYINIFHSFFTRLARIIEEIEFVEKLKKNHQINPHVWWARWFTVILLCVVLKYVKAKRKNWYSHVQQIQWEKLKRERERESSKHLYVRFSSFIFQRRKGHSF